MGCSVCHAGNNLPYAVPSRRPPDPSLFPYYRQNRQNLWLRFTEWWPRVPSSEVKYVVFIISGLGEHANRYDSIAVRLNREGAACFSLDNVGSGGSEGCRLYVERFDHFVDDIEDFMAGILERYPELKGLPRVLLGHSMGGLIGFFTAVRAPAGFFDAVILSGPAFSVAMNSPGPCMRKVLNFLSKTVPKMKLTRLNAKLVSYNTPVVELVKQDPYYSNEKLRARFLAEFLDAQDRAFVEVKKVIKEFPLLVIFGKDDKLCGLARAQEIFNLFPSSSKKMIIYPNSGHEVMTEVNRDIVLNDVVNFIKAHCK
ncbi:unnamed protein product [Phytomonas sp. Hart1]|nr:unnamed protein product [Phytomonas sp. Hart1]|eukprot:CCW71589.1 unnamed protein product [Phytomonas sp. isolate Hart1]